MFSRFSLPLAYRTTARSFHVSAQNAAIKPFLLADIGEGITECEIVQWFVEPGAAVNEFDKICEVQSDKATVEISSRYAGNIVKIHYKPHQVAKVGFPLVDIDVIDEEEVSSSVDSQEDVTVTTTTSVSNSSYVAAAQWETPAVKRLLHEYGLTINDVKGSGKQGRVLKGDVLSLIKSSALKKQVFKSPVDIIIPPSMPSVTSNDKEVPLNSIQKAMFKTMTKSLSIPQLGLKDEIELNATTEYRHALNSYIQQNPERFPFKKISYLPIFIKSLSLSLSYFPLLNAQLTNDQIIYRKQHNIGVAMDTPKGLIVPNIKNVQQKTIFEIAQEIHRLSDLAKNGTIPLNDLKGGTITLSNIGSIGGTYANPIIVENELAIVALGFARKMPKFEKEVLVAKQIMPISWSADHRIIDGATIAQFSNTWKSFIENPALLASKLH